METVKDTAATLRAMLDVARKTASSELHNLLLNAWALEGDARAYRDPEESDTDLADAMRGYLYSINDQVTIGRALQGALLELGGFTVDAAINWDALLEYEQEAETKFLAADFKLWTPETL